MAGRRLLDVAKLFSVARGVTQKHVTLRRQQIDVYTRTSTLAREIKAQTERINETAQAASQLYSRLNDTTPQWAEDSATSDKPASPDRPEHPIDPVALQQTHTLGTGAQNEGLEQDHFYKRSKENSATDPLPKEKLKVEQAIARKDALPDGTIPPTQADLDSLTANKTPVEGLEQDHFYRRSSENAALDKEPNDELQIKQAVAGKAPLPDGTIPTTEVEIESLKGSHDSDTSAKISTEGMGQDHFYDKSKKNSSIDPSPHQDFELHQASAQEPPLADGTIPPSKADLTTLAQGQRVQEKNVSTRVDDDEAPDGVDLAVFHNPRIARQLGGKVQGPFGRKAETASRASGSKPFEGLKMKLPKESVSPGSAPESKYMKEEWSETSPMNPSADIKELSDDLATTATVSSENPKSQPYQLRESRIPSSRIGRLWNYGGLAAGMFGGAVSEGFRRAAGGGGDGSYMLSASNIDRLVTKLSRMRGAALKLGQMISFQDSKMLPPAIQQVLQRVQDSADYMPASQRDKVLTADLGANWRDLFEEFEETPIAAASIGQVHRATLKNGDAVAVKIQYPGVASSIDSDLNNLAILLTASRLLPKGLYLDKTIANARTELAWECDYVREAECLQRFQTLLKDDDVFIVPNVYLEASGKQVLTMSYMDGVGVTKIQNFTQDQRDWIGTQILQLCLREITEFRFMQTDPNWTNFLYNADTQKLELLDFGASREYPEKFVTLYTRLLAAASKSEREKVRDLSIELGYLTGHESKTMLDAHLGSIMTLAEPFLDTSPEVYDFRDQTITERVKAYIPVMLRERLSPPPEETYSLHRKLSGAFLLCARLGSRVRCREMFEKSMTKAGLQ